MARAGIVDNSFKVAEGVEGRLGGSTGLAGEGEDFGAGVVATFTGAAAVGVGTLGARGWNFR